MSHPVICVSPVEWNSLRQRPQILMEFMQEHRPVVFLEPVGLRSLRLSDWKRVLHKAFFHFSSRLSPKPGFNIQVVTPKYLPFTWAGKLNNLSYRLTVLRLKRTLKRLEGGRFPVLWIGAPSPLALYLLKHLESEFAVYDCMDNFPAFHREFQRIEKDEREIIHGVDLVLTASKALYDRIYPHAPHARMAPNGVDFERFRSCPEPCTRPQDLPRGKPVIGYHGAISGWFDLDLVKHLARSRPSWQITLIGPENRKLPRKNLPHNVHFLGRKPFHQLPSYLSFFDVGIIPFTQDPVALHSNPIKAYEYLAMGLPVVSTRIPELLAYRRFVHIASSRDEFVQMVENCLRRPPTDQERRDRMEAAESLSWDKVFRGIMDIFDEFKEKRETK